MQLAALRAGARAKGFADCARTCLRPARACPGRVPCGIAKPFARAPPRRAGLRPPLVGPTLSMVAAAPAASVRPPGGPPQACALPRSGGHGLDARTPASRLPRTQRLPALRLRPCMHKAMACRAGSSYSPPARRSLQLGRSGRWAHPALATAMVQAAAAEIAGALSERILRGPTGHVDLRRQHSVRSVVWSSRFSTTGSL